MFPDCDSSNIVIDFHDHVFINNETAGAGFLNKTNCFSMISKKWMFRNFLAVSWSFHSCVSHSDLQCFFMIVQRSFQSRRVEKQFSISPFFQKLSLFENFNETMIFDHASFFLSSVFAFFHWISGTPWLHPCLLIGHRSPRPSLLLPHFLLLLAVFSNANT